MSEAPIGTAGAPAVPERASLADWLAVLAGMIGSLMALMDVSIVNSALPKIQGEIGATASEATWVGTGFLVAEIIVIPLTAWLERMLGLRRLLLGGSAIFTMFSVVCGFATSLEMLVIGRIGQGFSGGVLIPSAITLVAKRLPPSQQAIGMAVTAMASLLGPVLGPLLGGWLTENFSWHYAFFINVPICAVQMAMLLYGIKGAPCDWSELRKADWFGVSGMVIGLGAATTMLEEGHREMWFESTLIWQLALAALLGFGLIAYGQLRSERPVIRLALLGNASLASAVVLLAVLGMLLYTGMFIAPQFLVLVAGHTSLQAASLMFVSGMISIVAAVVYLALLSRVDTRLLLVCAGLSIAIANYLLSGLTVQSTARDFLMAQLLFGVGTTLSAIPLQMAVISSVSAEDSSEATSLSAVARNLGGAIGLAVLASFQEQRFELHHWRIHSALGANDPVVQQSMADGAALFGGGPEGLEAAYLALDGQVQMQALTMSFNDIYIALAVAAVLALPMLFFMRRPPAGAQMGAMH
ncbi:MAG: DHA2 family efflux MFS transporter permease subunit [Novosphingobium sp.]